MAGSTQKKSTSGKKSSTTSRSSSTRSTSSRSTSSRNAAAKKAAAKKPIRRGVWCGVFLFLSLCTFLTYFKVEAMLLDLLKELFCGLFGYGYWLTGPALLLASIILFLHHGRPVLLRTISALLLPMLGGGLVHVFASKQVLTSEVGLIPTLWKSGIQMTSGGVFAGLLSHGLVTVVSKLGAAAILAALFVLFLMLALKLTFGGIAESYRDRPRYEPEPERPHIHVNQLEPKRSTTQRPKPVIDIPLDGEERPEPPARSGHFTGFFRHKAEHQQTPDQVLMEEKAAARSAAAAAAAVATPTKPVTPAIPVKEPVSPVREPEPEQPAPAPVEQPAEKPAKPQSVFEAIMSRKPIEKPVEPPAEPPAPPAQTPAPVQQPQPAAPVVEESARKEKARTASEVAAQTAAVTAEIEEKMAEEENLYQFPPITLLKENHADNHLEAGAELRNNSRRLADTLSSFGVSASAGDVVHGPSVTRYEFTLEQGVKLNKITNLADDIALALGATGVRIAPIPDKISVVGIEVPNKQVTPVLIRDVIESRNFTEHRSQTAFALGRDIAGQNIIGDIERLPHVLIAGTTGSGKSVCTNSLIISLLYKSSPEQVRFIMVDPKMVELAPYNGIPHLLIPVVTDPKKAAGALQWAVFEMMKRYKMFSEHGVKKLEEFNRLAKASDELETMPSVVVVIDELADLMLVAAKEVEESICRVAQMGRAAGVHLVIATQRPSADVITGLMKANIPSRIAFAVASSLESRIILDNSGAEKLVGKGDMLYAPLGAGKPTRVQGCFISPEEIEKVVEFVKQTGEAQYSDEVMAKIEESVQSKEGKNSGSGASASSSDDSGEDRDEMFDAAVEVVLELGQASVSMLQRRLKLGYSRAARLVDQMEEYGVVGPFEGSKPRQLLINKAQWQEMKMGGTPAADEPPFPMDDAEG